MSDTDTAARLAAITRELARLGRPPSAIPFSVTVEVAPGPTTGVRRTQNRRQDYLPRPILDPYLRAEVLAAGTCEWCRTTANLTVDHVHPQGLGGTHDRENLRVLCRRCNSVKGMTIGDERKARALGADP